MGVIISNQHGFKRVSEANIKAFIEQTTKRYQKLFDSKPPTFVTYYSLSISEGSVDPTLRGADEIVGRDSPLVYSSVDNMPIYNVSQFDLNRDYDEIVGSATGEVSGEAYTLPTSVEPRENDYFVLEHLESRPLFRITAVNVDRIEGIAYHRLSFILDDGMETEGRLVEQVPEEDTYEFDMDGVGSDETPAIIQKIGKRLKDQLSATMYDLKVWYVAKYYDEDYGRFVHTSPNGFLVHDEMLEHFIYRNGIFHTKEYLRSLSATATHWTEIYYSQLSGYHQYEVTDDPHDKWVNRWHIYLRQASTAHFTSPFYGTPKGYYYKAHHDIDEHGHDYVELTSQEGKFRHDALKSLLYGDPLNGIEMEQLFPARTHSFGSLQNNNSKTYWGILTGAFEPVVINTTNRTSRAATNKEARDRMESFIDKLDTEAFYYDEDYRTYWILPLVFDTGNRLISYYSTNN